MTSPRACPRPATAATVATSRPHWSRPTLARLDMEAGRRSVRLQRANQVVRLLLFTFLFNLFFFPPYLPHTHCPS
jgi:hypothetical protein